MTDTKDAPDNREMAEATHEERESARIRLIARLPQELRLIQQEMSDFHDSTGRIAVMLGELIDVLKLDHPLPDQAMTLLRTLENEIDALPGDD